MSPTTTSQGFSLSVTFILKTGSMYDLYTVIIWILDFFWVSNHDFYYIVSWILLYKHLNTRHYDLNSNYWSGIQILPVFWQKHWNLKFKWITLTTPKNHHTQNMCLCVCVGIICMFLILLLLSFCIQVFGVLHLLSC